MGPVSQCYILRIERRCPQQVVGTNDLRLKKFARVPTLCPKTFQLTEAVEFQHKHKQVSKVWCGSPSSCAAMGEVEARAATKFLMRRLT
jgi:hypothetical protein